MARARAAKQDGAVHEAHTRGRPCEAPQCCWSPSSGVPRRSLARARTGTPTHAPATGPVAETQWPALLLFALCAADCALSLTP
eukprot:scaffold52131_cov57-Phaeocystis_antarctica.AAC.2